MPNTDITIDIFKKSSKKIYINSHKYYIPGTIFKKYFVLSEVDSTRFTDVHNYILEIDGTQASEDICDKIILDVCTNFSTGLIWQDPEYKKWYDQFVDMFLKQESIQLPTARIRDIQDSLDMVELWLKNGVRAIDSEIIYNNIGYAFINTLRKYGGIYAGCKHWSFNLISNESRIEPDGNITFNLGLNDSISKMALMLLHATKTNIYDKMFERLKVTEHEKHLYCIDTKKYGVPPKYF